MASNYLGAFGDIFLGQAGSGVEGLALGQLPSSSISTLPNLTPEQQAMLKQLLGELSGSGATPFTGQLTAGMSDLEGLSLEALEAQIMQRVQGGGVNADASKALSRMLETGGAPVDFEDFFQKSVRDPTLQDFSERVLPELTRRFGSSGAFGSDRLLAEQQATERLGKTLAGTRGELAYKTQSDAMNRILQAVGLAPQVESSGVDSLMKLMQGASLPRSIEQTRLTADYGEFQRQQEQLKQRREQILAALGIKPVENIAQTTPGMTGAASTSTNAFLGGGAGNMTSGGGGFFSDRRLKTDIVPLDVMPSGLGLYSFRYKFDPRLLRVGVMADEVREIMPEAIITRDDGMMLVNYGMLAEAGMFSGVPIWYMR